MVSTDTMGVFFKLTEWIEGVVPPGQTCFHWAEFTVRILEDYFHDLCSVF